eukprot:TRINITY_DN1810_c0_g1_i1.p1 TRINITY_DN1810_c0_g1~~TRINITY_DN1810_c0_g1_i1.p1  ORF type:complete len:176 (-),score=44.48 TRINITY_DN1810_c0_g1_i1:65-592(-)
MGQNDNIKTASTGDKWKIWKSTAEPTITTTTIPHAPPPPPLPSKKDSKFKFWKNSKSQTAKDSSRYETWKANKNNPEIKAEKKESKLPFWKPKEEANVSVMIQDYNKQYHSKIAAQDTFLGKTKSTLAKGVDKVTPGPLAFRNLKLCTIIGLILLCILLVILVPIVLKLAKFGVA